jgi:integrase
MSEHHPTAPAGPSKPAKPRPDFPLFPHATGRWAKKIRGKLHYFGPWADADGALERYLSQKDDLHAGRKPRQVSEGVTVKDAANAFLNHKQALVDSGELSPRTWEEYRATADLVVKGFGKGRLAADLGPDDFAKLRARMAAKWGPVRLGNEIQRVRSVFKHAHESELLDRPVRFGLGFARPSKKTLRLERARKPPRMFEAAELRRMLGAAGPTLRAMLLLGANAAFGNADCGTLPLAALDLEGGWVSYARVKTGIPRRAALWPETVQALREALRQRPEPKRPEHAAMAFLTKFGAPWFKGDTTNPLSAETRKLLDALGIRGRNFYALRHVFETVAGESGDQAAVDHVMGHAREDMASVYRERISDERLRAVSDRVRKWLFPRGAS